MPVSQTKIFGLLFSSASRGGIFAFMAPVKKIYRCTFIFCVAGITALSAEPGRTDLPDQIPAAISKLVAKGRLPATNLLSLAIGLPLRNESELDKFISQLYEPASLNFHKFIQPAEFTARFGATEADYAAVRKFAEQNGFVVTGTSPNRMVLDVQASVANAERAFHIALHTYRHPREARDFFAPDSAPSVDLNLPILHVSGLDNFLIPRPAILQKRLLEKNESARVSPASGSGIAGLYAGNDFHTAYAPGVALNGTGQAVALFELEGYYTNDIIAYENQTGLPNLTLTNVLVDSFSGTPTGTDTNGVIEVALDIDMALAMATNLSRVIVYEGQNGGINVNVDILNRMVSDNLAKQISSSWLIGNSPNYDTAYKQMAAQGQSFFQASGDDGAYYSGIAQSADDTNITLVGGTTLTMAGSGSAYTSETVWNWYITGEGTAGSGGGTSLSGTAIPSWQTNISMTANQGSTTLRNVPDVALTADGILVVAYGGNYSVGGTSAAAPLWAGFTALVNQQAASLGESPVGFLNPAIYALGKSANYSLAFHDITTGNNTNTTVGTKYSATTGYDLCTGWGTPNGQNFINALAPPDTLVITPPIGFNASGATGGPFSPNSQNYLLTNTSAAPVVWSLISPSAWLNASAAGGTLPANGTNGVTISLNAAANSLAAGTYPATVQFTNGTTHVVQSLQFNLQVTEPLLLLTAGGFSAYGPAGGLFYPGSQIVVFTNQGAAAQNWSIINPAAWLSVSTGSGSVAGNSSVSLTVSTNAATATLANGVYSATLLLSNQASHVVQSLPFSAFIGQSLVQNGGFETGNFTGWTLSGNSSSATVSASSSYVHSGTNGMRATTSGTFGYISQNLSTAPGQTYQLSFWFENKNGSTGEQLQAFWNGTSLYSTTSLPTSWTNQKIIVTATGTSTPLQFGFLTSSTATKFGLDDISITPVNLPAITQPPAGQTNLAGSNVVFTAAASGTAPLGYQWCTNGVGLVNGGVIAGATSNTLMLTAIGPNNAGNYTVVVTNAYGSVTSSIAVLTVVLPPAIASSSLTNRILQCGGNTNVFTVTTTGTAPLNYQWSFDGSPVLNATNTSYSVTNLHLPNHTISVVITNLYGSLTSNAVLTVQDTLAPAITLAGANPFYIELSNAFTDPGATATDACAGAVSVIVSGAVNTNSVGTNTLTYKAGDGNGNTNTATRTVIVRDTTAPTILWSFTNLVLVANSNCIALMTNVTGTNFILATDLSGALTITQSPTNNFILPLGTNPVVITVADASGNAAYSTNTIIVQDQTPPQILSQPQSQTNFIGTTATFNFAATACTPLTFQWYSNNTLTIFTNTTLTLSNLVVSATGNYFAVANANGGATTSAVVTLTVNLYPPTINSGIFSFNGGFNLNLSGTPGYTYILEATTNLLPIGNWLPIATNTLSTNGVWSFTDSTATNFPFQFYRLKLAP